MPMITCRFYGAAIPGGRNRSSPEKREKAEGPTTASCVGIVHRRAAARLAARSMIRATELKTHHRQPQSLSRLLGIAIR